MCIAAAARPYPSDAQLAKVHLGTVATHAAGDPLPPVAAVFAVLGALVVAMVTNWALQAD